MVAKRGTNRADVLVGTVFEDTLNGRGGNDILRGFGSDDVLRGGLGADRLVGGSGQDWADYRDATTAVTVNLLDASLNAGEALGDTFVSIERIRGSQFDDTLVGNALDNVLEGGAGADTLNGGDGFDFARYRLSSVGVTVSLANPSSNNGHASGDTYISIEGIQGSNFDDTLIGNGGDNVFIGDGGADAFNGGGGFDFARYRTKQVTSGVTASLADSTINTGVAAGDTYTSIEGLIGTRFRDRLFGDNIGNVLNGDAGNDRLDGGLGNDTLTGGAGKDAFAFDTALSANVDQITDFSVVNDTIRLENAIFANTGPIGTLTRSRFFTGAAAHDASDRIIYDRTTGALFYDADGTGAQAQVQFAQLKAGLFLTNADFVIT
jgi:Ca2+-binding RTX toxin-like protein